MAEMKDELKDFVQLRIEMFKIELHEKSKTLKIAGPLAVFGIILLATAYLLFTLAVVGLVAAFLPDNRYRWFLAFAAVGVLWTLVGGVAAYFAKRELETKSLMPNKTIEILKEDKLWIQAEARNQV